MAVFKANIDGNEIDYSLLERLGQGTFGRAELCDSRRQVVLKRVPLDNVAFENKNVLKLAEGEAKVLETLCHPNIVRIYNSWTDQKAREIVMELEYCGGKSLAYAISTTDKRFDMAKVKRWLAQLALGIAYIHDMGIIHRDIKPENVLLSTDLQTLKIADFGTAKLSTSSAASTVGTIGTVAYMAPEMYDDTNPTVEDGGDELSEEQRCALFEAKTKVDVWAYGILAFELAILELPYKIRSSLTGTIDMMLQFQRREKPAKICEIEQFYCRSLRQLIDEKLLVYNPRQRANMDQVLQDEFLVDEACKLKKDYTNYVQDHMKSHRKVLPSNYQQTPTVLLPPREPLNQLKQDLQKAEDLNSTLKKKLEDAELKAADLEKRNQTATATEIQLTAKISELESQLKQFEERVKESQRRSSVSSRSSTTKAKIVVVDDARQIELFQACYEGDTRRARFLLSKCQVDVNARYNKAKHGSRLLVTTNGQTCVKLAAMSGHAETVQMLINEFKANVDQQDDEGWAPLHNAAQLGFLNLVRLLCEDGNGNLEVKNQNGSTALMFAASGGHYEVVEYLLNRGANVTEKDKYGYTALLLSNVYIIQELLRKRGST